MIDRVEALDRAGAHRLGMLVFIVSEAFFFGMLILAFLFYRGAWFGQLGAPRLDVGLTAIFTALLLSSSVTIWFAERAARAGRPAVARRWLLATILLGAAFLLGQGWEYTRLIGEGVTIGSGLFGTTFYTLTGFHGFHVFGGLVMLVILLGLALAGVDAIVGPHAVALETISLYWHFVDVVWIVVFSLVYLWTLLP